MSRHFRHRGVNRIVGNLVQPSAEALAALHAKGTFHSLLGDASGATPAPPATIDYLTAAAAGLATMLANGPDPSAPRAIADTGVGDCVVAADYHALTSRMCNAGIPHVPCAQCVLRTYEQLTGYVLGDPSTDNGTDPLALVAYRRAGHRYADGSVLLDAVAVDATNGTALRQGIWLATGALAWASLPDAWESEEDAGSVWDVAGPPNPANGHGFHLVDYTEIGPRVCTWGEIVQLTWAAAARYLTTAAGGGCLALIDRDIVSTATARAPSGFDFSTLTAYVDALRAPAAAAAP